MINTLLLTETKSRLAGTDSEKFRLFQPNTTLSYGSRGYGGHYEGLPGL